MLKHIKRQDFINKNDFFIEFLYYTYNIKILINEI